MSNNFYTPTDQALSFESFPNRLSQRNSYNLDFAVEKSIQTEKLVEEVEKWRASYTVWNSIIKRTQNIISVFVNSLDHVIQYENQNENRTNIPNSNVADNSLQHLSGDDIFELKFLHDDEFMLNAIFSQNFMPAEQFSDSNTAIESHQTMLEDLSNSIEKCYALFKDIRGSFIKIRNERSLLVKKLGKQEQQKLPSWLMSRQFYEADDGASYVTKNLNKSNSVALLSSAGPKLTQNRYESSINARKACRERASTGHTRQPYSTNTFQDEGYLSNTSFDTENPKQFDMGSYIELIDTLKVELAESKLETLRYRKLNSKMEVLLKDMQIALDKSYTDLCRARIENPENCNKLKKISEFSQVKRNPENLNHLNPVQFEFNTILLDLVEKSAFSADKNVNFTHKVKQICSLLENTQLLPSQIQIRTGNDFAGNDFNPVLHQNLSPAIDRTTNFTCESPIEYGKDTRHGDYTRSISIYPKLSLNVFGTYSNICNAYSLVSNALIGIIGAFKDQFKIDKPVTLEISDFLELLELQSFKVGEVIALITSHAKPSPQSEPTDNNSIDGFIKLTEKALSSLYSSNNDFAPENQPEKKRGFMEHHENIRESGEQISSIESEALNLNSETAQMVNMLTDNSFLDSLVADFKEYLSNDGLMLCYHKVESKDLKVQNIKEAEIQKDISDISSETSSKELSRQQKIIKTEFAKSKNKIKNFYRTKLADENLKVYKLQLELDDIKDKAEKKISEYLKIRDYQFEKIINISVKNAILVKMKQIVMDAIGGTQVFLDVLNTNYASVKDYAKDKRSTYLWKRAKSVRYAIRLRLSLESLQKRTEMVNKLRVQIKELHDTSN